MNQNLNIAVREAATPNGQMRIEPSMGEPSLTPVVASVQPSVRPVPVQPVTQTAQPVQPQVQPHPATPAQSPSQAQQQAPQLTQPQQLAPQPVQVQAATVSAQVASPNHAQPIAQPVPAFPPETGPTPVASASQVQAAQPQPASPVTKQSNLDFISSQRGTGEFKKAQRHTYLVKSLKFLLPLIGVVVIGIFAGALIFRPSVPELKIESTSLSNGKLVMENPDLKGFDGQKRPYALTASKAIQDPTKPGQIELETIDARVAVAEGNFASVTAGTGFYDSNAKTLTLGGNVNVVTDDGMQIEMLNADMDIGKGTLKTSNPVKVRTSGADISADTLVVENNGDKIVFNKRVKLTLRPNKLPKDDAANQ